MPENIKIQDNVQYIILEVKHISSLLNEREKNIHGMGEYQDGIKDLTVRLRNLREEYKNEINKEEAEALKEEIEELQQGINKKRGEREQGRKGLENKIRESAKSLETTVEKIT